MNFTSLYEITNALTGMDELRRTGRTENTPSFYRPYHFVILALTISQAGPNRFEMTDTDANFIRYASRMHLWTAVGQTPPISVTEWDSRGRFHPLTKLIDRNIVHEVSRDLSLIFNATGEESVRSIDQTAAELLDNCHAHSEAHGMCGFVCAQRWENANKAQVAIGDSGIGIRRSLMQSPEYAEILKTENSCELASRYEVTSKRGMGHSGFGLTLARDVIQNNGGTFFLVSYDEYYVSKAGREESGRLPVAHPGTLVVLEWNTQVPLRTVDVYDSWPSLDGDFYDDEFNF